MPSLSLVNLAYMLILKIPDFHTTIQELIICVKWSIFLSKDLNWEIEKIKALESAPKFIGRETLDEILVCQSVAVWGLWKMWLIWFNEASEAILLRFFSNASGPSPTVKKRGQHGNWKVQVIITKKNKIQKLVKAIRY